MPVPMVRGKGVFVKGPPARHEEPKEQYPAVEGIIRDAAEMHVGDRVVYPNQGVCQVTGIEKKEIAGQKLELVRMVREEDGAAVLVPKAKVPTGGLRKVDEFRPGFLRRAGLRYYYFAHRCLSFCCPRCRAGGYEKNSPGPRGRGFVVRWCQ